jgi:hypothetical protein
LRSWRLRDGAGHEDVPLREHLAAAVAEERPCALFSSVSCFLRIEEVVLRPVLVTRRRAGLAAGLTPRRRLAGEQCAPSPALPGSIHPPAQGRGSKGAGQTLYDKRQLSAVGREPAASAFPALLRSGSPASSQALYCAPATFGVQGVPQYEALFFPRRVLLITPHRAARDGRKFRA